MTDSVKPLKNIQRRVEEVLRKHGIVPHHTTFVVEPQVGLQVACSADPDWHEPDPVLDELDAIAKATEADERRRAQDAASEKSRKDLVDLKDQLKRPEEGIL